MSVSISLLLLEVHQCDDSKDTCCKQAGLENTFLRNERGRSSAQVSKCLWIMSLPGSPHCLFAAAALLLQPGGPDGEEARRDTLMEMLRLLEALRTRRRRRSSSGLGQEVHRVPPAVREALAEEPRLQLQLLPEEADGHLQDVSLLQLGVGLLLVELLLQDDLELVDAAVDAIPSHFFHHRFSQLEKAK